MFRLPCTKCGSSQFPHYYRTKLMQSGRRTNLRSSICVICMREDYRLRYERVKQDPIRYAKHLKANIKYQLKNKRKIREYQRHWEKFNAQSRRLSKQEYYLANKEKILARNKVWKLKNRKPMGIRDNKNHIWRVLNDGIKK